jgi:hypothetical protein
VALSLEMHNEMATMVERLDVNIIFVGSVGELIYLVEVVLSG